MKFPSKSKTTYDFTGHQATLDADVISITAIQKSDLDHNGTIDKTITTTQLTTNVVETKTDLNGDGKVDVDVLTKSGVSYNLLDMNQLNALHTSGVISNDFWSSFTNDTSSLLTGGLGLNPGSSGLGLQPPSWIDPIGAFYDSQSTTYDNAASIASKTGVLTDASGNKMSSAQVATLDTNHDGSLSSSEAASLRLLTDANEDGHLNSGELNAITQAIRQQDWAFYTQGNAYMVGATPASPTGVSVNAPTRVDRTQAVPASNYRTLRDTDNRYFVYGGWIDFSASQIKINFNNRSYLIGTDGADNFDSSYYAAYPQYFNSSLLTNFLAGGGDDVMGGSTRNDNVWGGTGNDTLFGYCSQGFGAWRGIRTKRSGCAQSTVHNERSINMPKRSFIRSQKAAVLTGLLLSAIFTQVVCAQVQDPSRSYADRQNPLLSQSGPIYMDPNVYAYTAEFAKRFQMPEQWIAPDLKGADAVAWRMMPSYQECGWGGNPKACRQVMECKIDLYFDHQRNPLPWDPTRAERYTTISGSSLNFLANFPRREALNHPNYPVAWRKLHEPARPGDHFAADDSPFIDPQTGKGLSIQDFNGYVPFTGYDKEVFPGMALITLLDPGCRGGSSNAAYALANDLVRRPVNLRDKAIVRAVALPISWRERITQAAKEHQERQDAFFKREGEKAIKALQEKKAQQ